MLLAAYETRRPTRDIDLQGRQMSNDADQVLGMVRTIAARQLDDGLAFDPDLATADIIRDEDVYRGVRVTLGGHLSAARVTLHVDVNIGDPIWPAPTSVALPRLLEGEIVVIGYPLPMVHAEKLVTAVQRGVANTRWRDFADVYLLARRHDIVGAELSGSIERVARHRHVRTTPLSQVLEGYPVLAQRRWMAWRRKHRLDDRLPADFTAVLDQVIAFADPVLNGMAGEDKWVAARLAWTPRR